MRAASNEDMQKCGCPAIHPVMRGHKSKPIVAKRNPAWRDAEIVNESAENQGNWTVGIGVRVGPAFCGICAPGQIK